MHLLKNKFLILILLVATFLVQNIPLFAQNEGFDFGPNIFIPKISLDKTQYKSGDEITGNFTLVNNTAEDSGELHYTMALGEYAVGETEFAKITYDISNTYGPVQISSNASSTIPFTYKLPAGVAGKNLGILFTLFQGKELKLIFYAVKKFEIPGESVSRLSTHQTNASLNGTIYRIGEFPTILSSDQVMILSEVSNDTDESITVIPQIEIHSSYAKSADSLVSSYKAPPQTIKPEQNSSIAIPISLTNLTPQQYFGIVRYVDDKDLVRLSPTLFQFYFAENLYTIDSIETPGTFLEEGKDFEIITHLKPDPIHAKNTDVEIIRDDLTLITSVHSLKGDEIASNSIKPSSYDPDISFSFVPILNFNGYKVKSVLMLGDKVIEEKEVRLSPDYLKYAKHPYAYIFYGILILLISILILRKIFKPKEFGPEYYPPQGGELS